MANIHKLKGEMNRRTTSYLRYHCTSNWRDAAFKKANYKCEISKKESCAKNPLVVHHLTKPFDVIVREAHQQLNLDFHRVIDGYESSDLKALVDLVKEMHKDVEAIVLTKGLHTKIHDKFGANPNPEDIKTYKKEYRRKQYKHKNYGYKKTA